MNTLTKIASLLMVSTSLMAAPLASATPHDHKPAQTKQVKKQAKKTVKHKKAAQPKKVVHAKKAAPKKAVKAKKAAPKKVAKKNVKRVKHAQHRAHR
ncbi:acid-shock protein [Neisseria brasiliensis]|uniref:acid-shock protein n=1 Tax=Neisseria TaxID=482 RepID=UPI000C27143F|nr:MULTISPECIES: acid-shock protein [Neisseria]PJO78163.1 acid-shock protein [Neisseria sp. N177_16]QGL24604.1 acid-shock protein [Neisseria brasiliensis]